MNGGQVRKSSWFESRLDSRVRRILMRLAEKEPRIMDVFGVVLMAFGANQMFGAVTLTDQLLAAKTPIEGYWVVVFELAAALSIEMAGASLVMIGQDLIAFRERVRALNPQVAKSDIVEQAKVYVDYTEHATFRYRLWTLAFGLMGFIGLFVGKIFSYRIINTI